MASSQGNGNLRSSFACRSQLYLPEITKVLPAYTLFHVFAKVFFANSLFCTFAKVFHYTVPIHKFLTFL